MNYLKQTDYNLSFNPAIYELYNSFRVAVLYDYISKKISLNSMVKIKRKSLQKLFYSKNNNTILTDLKKFCKVYKNIDAYNKAVNKFENKPFCMFLSNDKEYLMTFKNETNERIMLEQVINEKSFKEYIDFRLKDKMEIFEEDNDVKLNNIISIAYKKEIKDFIVSDFVANNEILKKEFQGWLYVRQKKLTQSIVNDFCEKLALLSKYETSAAIEICKRSAMFNWADLYSLDKSTKSLKGKKWIGYNELNKMKEYTKKDLKTTKEDVKNINDKLYEEFFGGN